jgi:hypothetical protein
MTRSGKDSEMDRGQPYVYVIRVDFHDGTARHPVMIYRGEPGWETDLEEAIAYFTHLHRGKGVVSIDYARNIYDAGVNDIESIEEWKKFKARGQL